MSPGLVKMWVSISGMGTMFLSIVFIYFGRYKLKGFLKGIFTILAYILMIISGILIFIVVMSGPGDF